MCLGNSPCLICAVQLLDTEKVNLSVLATWRCSGTYCPWPTTRMSKLSSRKRQTRKTRYSYQSKRNPVSLDLLKFKWPNLTAECAAKDPEESSNSYVVEIDMTKVAYGYIISFNQIRARWHSREHNNPQRFNSRWLINLVNFSFLKKYYQRLCPPLVRFLESLSVPHRSHCLILSFKFDRDGLVRVATSRSYLYAL